MKINDLLKLSTRMFKARTSQTLLTVCGMSIGIGAILFLVSLGFGLQKTLLERITTSESLLTLDVTEAKSGVIKLNKETLEEIQKMEGVDKISSAFQFTAQGRLEDLSADLISVGTDPLFLRLGGFKATQGELLSDEEAEGVVITSAVAKLYGKEANEMMGKEMTFSVFIPRQKPEREENLQSDFEKVDLSAKYAIIGSVEGEENVVYINSKTFEGIKVESYNQVKVKCASSSQMDQVRNSILEKGLLVSSLSETVDQANKIFQVIQVILMLFGIIALVVSAIGMFNTMTIALLERTEEIGIMKSVGASSMGIALIFFTEAALMGFLGGIGGLVLGYAGGEVFNWLINMVAVRFGGEKVDLFYSPLWFIVMIIISSAVVGVATGLMPARRASKIDPLEALRYK
jgi:ABC-type antimicrobial peptide transport system permease subunit